MSALAEITGAAARAYAEHGKWLPRRDPRQPPPAYPPFKRYPGSRRIPLHALSGAGGPLASPPGGGALARLLGHTYAPSRLLDASWPPGAPVGQADRPGAARTGTALRWSVPSGGAYYPVELYLIDWCGTVVPPGIYHLDALTQAIELLQPGVPADEELAPARPGTLSVAAACRLWKNRGTYGDFGYRLGALDTGVVVAQLLVSAGPRAARPRFCFPDDRIDGLLGLDARVEATYALVDVALNRTGEGRKRNPPGSAQHRPEQHRPGRRPACTGLEAELAGLTQVPPLLRELHDRSRADGTVASEVPPPPLPEPAAVVRLPCGAASVQLGDGRPGRRSASALAPAPVTLAELSGLLAAAAAPGPVNVYLAANSVTGLEPGSYAYDPAAGTLRRLLSADLRPHLLRLAPSWPPASPSLTGGAVSLFVAGRYEPGFTILGDRWYRVQNMAAGMMAHRLCLAAGCLGLASRISLGYSVAGVDELLHLPAGHTALVQVILGRPAAMPGHYDRPLSAAPVRELPGRRDDA